MKAIYSYIDYRAFLRDYYEESKKLKSYFSYRYFAGKAGIKSPIFLSQVIKGERNLTGTMTERFVKALKLKERQATFFLHLVWFNQAKTALEKQEHYSVLREMGSIVNEKVIGQDAYDYFKNWYNAAIRELICMEGFRDDFKALANCIRPKITPKQAQKSIDLLLKIGMVRKEENGRYVQIDKALTTGQDVTSMAVRDFNRSMARLAVNAIDLFSIDRRHISGTTMAVSKAGYDIITAEILAFKERIVRIANENTESDRVYQMNVQLFPLSEHNKE